MKELIELLHKIGFYKTRVCKCKPKSDNIKDVLEALDGCNTCKEEYYTYEKIDGNSYKVYIDNEVWDFVRIDFKLANGAGENTFVDIKDMKQKLNEYSELKSLIRKSKIDSIIQMNEDTLMEKYIVEYRNLLYSIGFKMLDTGCRYSDIYILDNKEMHYRIIINNIDIDYSNTEKIEIKYFNKITNKRRGLNWHIKSSSVRQGIDKFFYYLPELKSILRKNKIEKLIN